MLRPIQCLLLVLLSGCSPATDSVDAGATDTRPPGADASADAPDEAGPLMDNEAWSPVAVAADPFDDRPDTIDCERGIGWDIEPLDPEPTTIGIDTSRCNYWGVEQPTLRAVEPGETLAVQVWHFQLEGDGPAHLGVAFDGEIVWETTVPIPSDGGLIYEEFDVPSGAPEGAQLVAHLHNHGLNTWNFIAIRPPDE